MRWFAYLLIIPLLVSCERPGGEKSNALALSLWAHSGQESERKTLQSQIDRFNRQNANIQLKITFIPERTYNSQVQAAALAGELPDIIELDGPYLYNYIWQGHLSPLDTLVSEKTKKDLIPTIVSQGTLNNQLYGVGTFDSGLGIYANKQLLEKAGIRIPADANDAWRAAEFDALLHKLAKNDADGAVLDLKLNYPDEWFTYALSPLLQSGGADLINRQTYQNARGVLDSSAAIGTMTQIQNWIKKGLLDSNVDDGAFIQGRVALSFAGHWEYARYSRALGDKLVLVPLPAFGEKTVTGQGSWLWAVSSQSQQRVAVSQVLEFLLETDEVLAMATANSAVPATHSAIQRSDLYRSGGPLHLFAQQLTQGFAIPRPKTPAYPVITSAFYQAFADIRDGADVKSALAEAANVIDQDIKDNKGYPMAP